MLRYALLEHCTGVLRVHFVTWYATWTWTLPPCYQQTRVVPVDWLRDLYIVDTPGTNAVVDGHQELTEAIIPRADLILFVTSADRPFSDSERAFLRQIWQWRKKIVVVVNKMDMLRSDEQREQVLQFVTSHASELLGEAPDVFPVSAFHAMAAAEAKASTVDDNVVVSGSAGAFAELEAYIQDTLTSWHRVRTKWSRLASFQNSSHRCAWVLLDVIPD